MLQGCPDGAAVQHNGPRGRGASLHHNSQFSAERQRTAFQRHGPRPRAFTGPVPVPAANKSFWSIAYPENYYDPQCQKRPHMLIEDCECACNALGGTLACLENPEQNDLLKSFLTGMMIL